MGKLVTWKKNEYSFSRPDSYSAYVGEYSAGHVELCTDGEEAGLYFYRRNDFCPYRWGRDGWKYSGYCKTLAGAKGAIERSVKEWAERAGLQVKS
jgi:hypothetical protein